MFCLALSLHLLPGDWNAVHPCVRYEHEGWVAGAFLNSEGRVSLSAGYEWTQGPWWVQLGGVTGYSGATVAPLLRGGYDFGQARLFVSPGLTGDGDVGLVLGLEIEMGRQ